MQLRHWLLLLYFGSSTVAVSVPALAALPGSVLGLPSAIVWNVGWVLASFVAVLAFHIADGGEA